MGITVLFSLILSLLTACGNAAAPQVSVRASGVTDSSAVVFSGNAEFPDPSSVTSSPDTDWLAASALKEIPESYLSPSSQQGTLEDLYYDTWESFRYAEQSQRLQKHAVVYLPYGYDPNTEYNVFYLMHGGWANENAILGTPGRPSSFKNVLDHAMEAGEIDPMILVCPTYNNTSEQDSSSFSLAMDLNRNYHNELVNDLIPAVEGTYSTYAKGISEQELMASRDHRGFGGFSMGSVATWRTFQHCLDYFHFFLPMSCGTSLEDAEIFSAAEGRDQGDYFVGIMTGTSDFAYRYVENRVEKLRESPYFTEGSNFVYLVKEGYSHNDQAAMEYTYNGFQWLWKPVSEASAAPYTVDTAITSVTGDPVFGDYGRLIFPVDGGYYSGDTLGELRMTWYNHIDPDKTVEITNYLKDHDDAGETIFYDIYTDEEKAAAPEKADTGLFFFRGEPGAPFAVCNAGGWAYVGAMHDRFPHALELSKRGYNAFALIYRPGAKTAYEDLGRALCFIFDHAEELQVSTDGFSLWGGSAGARMAATLRLPTVTPRPPRRMRPPTPAWAQATASQAGKPCSSV